MFQIQNEFCVCVDYTIVVTVHHVEEKVGILLIQRHSCDSKYQNLYN